MSLCWEAVKAPWIRVVSLISDLAARKIVQGFLEFCVLDVSDLVGKSSPCCSLLSEILWDAAPGPSQKSRLGGKVRRIVVCQRVPYTCRCLRPLRSVCQLISACKLTIIFSSVYLAAAESLNFMNVNWLAPSSRSPHQLTLLPTPIPASALKHLPRHLVGIFLENHVHNAWSFPWPNDKILSR